MICKAVRPKRKENFNTYWDVLGLNTLKLINRVCVVSQQKLLYMLYRIGHKKTFSWHRDFQAHAAVHALHGQRKESSLSFSHLSYSMLPRLSY